MANTKRLREALLESSKSAIEAGRSAVTGVAGAAGAVWLPVAEIAPDPDQPRTHYDEEAMRQLCTSIATLGQIEPIVVQALGGADRAAEPGRKYRCLSGHRRLRAHEALGLSEIRATIVRERLSADDRFRHEIASNEVREDHTDFDRARFMALVFADALEVDGDDAARLDRVRAVVNRAFNEFDRAGEFSAESAAAVAACEAALVALGERRNLRWFHRWGLPVLALSGAAREAAVAGLDARRTLSIAQLGGRGARGRASADRDRAMRRLADAAREREIPARDLAAAVKAIAAHLDAGSLTDERLADVLDRLARPSDEPEGAAEARRGKAKRRRATPDADALRARAAKLAKRWSVRSADSRKGKGSAGASLVDVVAACAATDPARAARFLAALERADAELEAIRATEGGRARRS